MNPTLRSQTDQGPHTRVNDGSCFQPNFSVESGKGSALLHVVSPAASRTTTVTTLSPQRISEPLETSPLLRSLKQVWPFPFLMFLSHLNPFHFPDTALSPPSQEKSVFLWLRCHSPVPACAHFFAPFPSVGYTSIRSLWELQRFHGYQKLNHHLLPRPPGGLL